MATGNPDWLDRLSHKLQTRPRSRLFFVLATLWIAITPGALVIIFMDPAAATDAGVETDSENGIRMEKVLGAILICLHLVFIFLTWLFWDQQVPAPEGSPSLDRESDAHSENGSAQS